MVWWAHAVSARMPTIAVSCPAGGTPLPIQKHHRRIRCRHDGRVAAGFCCHQGAVQQCQQWRGRRHEGRRCETHGGARQQPAREIGLREL
jgi:hypothetical protein